MDRTEDVEPHPITGKIISIAPTTAQEEWKENRLQIQPILENVIFSGHTLEIQAPK